MRSLPSEAAMAHCTQSSIVLHKPTSVDVAMQSGHEPPLAQKEGQHARPHRETKEHCYRKKLTERIC